MTAGLATVAYLASTILFILCFGFVIWYVTNHFRTTREGADA